MDLKISESDLSNLDIFAINEREYLTSIQKSIGNDNVEKAFEVPILYEALRIYREIEKLNGSWNGNMSSPHYFAYALKADFVSKQQVAGVNFGNNLTVDDFVENNYDGQILVNLRHRLFNPSSTTSMHSVNSLNDVSVDYSEKRA
jgi:hypothetical protein